MQAIGRPDLDALVRCAHRAAAYLEVEPFSDDELRRMVSEILFGEEKEVWPCLQERLITMQEARDLLMANLETWMHRQRGTPLEERRSLVGGGLEPDFERVLFGRTLGERR